MKFRFVLLAATVPALHATIPAEFTPAPQQFRQEIARSFTEKNGLPAGKVQLIDAVQPAPGRAGFFSNGWGYLPWTWSFGGSEIERFDVWQIE